MPKYRVAFLTPEFPTESIGSRGGLSNYLNRCSQALMDQGHSVEVFTKSDRDGETIQYYGASVHRVLPQASLLPMPYRQMALLPGKLKPTRALNALASAASIAKRFEQRHQEEPFDVVQSSDFDFPGYFVAPREGLAHIVRCSLTRSSLTELAPKRFGIGRPHDLRLLRYLERNLFHRVTGVYAPSEFASRSFTKRYKTQVGVVRPPYFAEPVPPADPLPRDLPNRFLFFVGHLNEAKGIDVLADALVLAWQHEPDIRMLWAGKGDYAPFAEQFGAHAEQVTHLGPIPKAVVYELMRTAVAVVAPSRIDNIPNVVIEAVSQGTPVIGTAGASIDEIVEQDKSGLLFPMEDSKALSKLMIEGWRGRAKEIRDRFRTPTILSQMEPSHAVGELLRFAGLNPTSAGRTDTLSNSPNDNS